MELRTHLIVAIAWAALSLGACGGPDTRPATNDDFRTVQAAEAVQNRNLSIARDPGTACASACEAAGATCAAARQICALARQTEDLDLRSRCQTAEGQCTEAQRQGTENRDDCACPAATP